MPEAEEILLMHSFDDLSMFNKLCSALGRGGEKLEKQMQKPVPEGSLAEPLHSQ